MQASKVFVVQENPGLDYTDAERFGDIRFITNQEFSSVSGSLNNKDILADIVYALASFNPKVDYLLMTGNPITIGYAFHRAMLRAISVAGDASPALYLLRWDGFSRTYKAVQF